MATLVFFQSIIIRERKKERKSLQKRKRKREKEKKEKDNKCAKEISKVWVEQTNTTTERKKKTHTKY